MLYFQYDLFQVTAFYAISNATLQGFQFSKCVPHIKKLYSSENNRL